ncbi:MULTISPECIES: hypothetical protein [unclassified Pseudomonas]|uniref:hypothetical protein n=1 Tax=unclassified Pseudomonas TaxID=196821 RepID=UPI000C86B2D4|nr:MULTISPECIES: hypothetical protein [unclassified Pseudomonas]PMV86336.1 hypothetical protein C1X56_14985 [Pseudomonas sp. GW101-1A09]PMV95526.1 hypothetical protein C1X55_21220 [Pseudomonas sp. GW460-C8]PMV97487.1 hypothetical protein C1X51_04475 [Pseudomonas sp. FW306-2-2C-B10A]PMW04838.1 hypothetical protein C1X50_15285 [Pseudomonas sp. MPR-TSA4]PMW13082.1 hypothetical protein C1X52_17855 [Pseudomonas sp. FW306-2-1A-C05A]
MEIDWQLSRTILSALNELVPATRRDIDSGGLHNELKARGVKLGLTAHYLLTVDYLVKEGYINSAGAVGEEDGFPHPHHLMSGLTQTGKDKLKSLHN